MRENAWAKAAWGLFRLSKIKVFQHYFGLVLAWLMVGPEALRRPETAPAMVLFLIGSMAIVACACSADDITGYRNGSDAVNYKTGEQLRDIRSKPLLQGAVTVSQAQTFAVVAGLVAVVVGILAFWVLGWSSPVEAYVLYGAGLLFSVQYSAGLRISFHRGGGEALLCLATAAGLLAPFLAVNRTWSLPAVIEALLLGLWLVMVSSCSNVNDAEGDRGVGRRTLAVSAPGAVLKGAMAAFFVTSAGLVMVLAFSSPDWPWWTLLTAAPAVAVHAWQLRVGPGQGQWLKARKLGLIAYNFGFVGIAVPTYVAFH